MKRKVTMLCWIFCMLAAGQACARQLYIVSIGTNKGFPSEPVLRYAERDAREVAGVLQKIGRVPGSRMVLSLGERADTVRAALLETNSRIRAAMDAGERDTALLVFFSGHADAGGLHLGSTLLPYKELKAMITGSPATVRVLILDACYSGGATQVKGMVPTGGFAIHLEKEQAVEGTVIITSSASGEESHESERLSASFFSHHLVNALRGAADKNRDGRVTLSEAYAYAYHQTLRSSGQTMALQHPTFRYEIKGRGDFILTWVGEQERDSAQLELAEAGLYLVMEGEDEGPVVAEVMTSEAGARLVLPPGNYFVQRRAQDHYREYKVRLLGGESLGLEDEPFRIVAYSRLLRKGGGSRRLVHSLWVGGGAHGEILKDHGPALEFTLGYAMDLPWLSLGLRIRMAWNEAVAVDGIANTEHWEVGLGLTLQRYIDLSFMSLALGLLVEGIHYRQEFSTPGESANRQAWGLAFGGLAAVEVEVVPAVVLRLEGGPMTYLLRHGVIRAGAHVDTSTESPLTWWASLGVGWRF